MVATPALAQEADDGFGLQEIIVTAQKREQSLQDVPIAVTAITGDVLAANRVTDVVDLSSLAPGMTVRVSAGGTNLPSFSVRGAVSYGVVPGSDKQVSVYLDGVYISSPRGAIFDLPDVERIEMLRGPQGTLFGRNSTAGAVSISTRDPSGEFGVKLGGTIGNKDAWRLRASVDTPQFGAFSAYASFVHNYRRGDIRNAGAGTVWDRTASLDGARTDTSPKWLGTKESDSFFAAVKFQPSDNFVTTYKFDRNEAGNSQSAEATGFIGLNPNLPLVGNLFSTLVASQPTPVNQAANGKRPKVVDNSWVIPSTQSNTGHTLTSTLELGDITLKNIAAFRKSFVHATSPIDGFSALTFTPETLVPYATFAGISALAAQGVDVSDPANGALVQATIGQIAGQLAPAVGSPFVGIGIGSQNRSKQWSDELQLNYDSDFLTMTAGAVWFKSKDWLNEHGLPNATSFTPVFGGILGNKQGISYNKAESIAAYAQAEFHLSPSIDVIAGARITRDKKSGTFTFGDLASPNVVSFTYKDTRPNFLVGVNYKPNDDTLFYAKYSTAFVSGGTVAGIPFEPETAKSIEGGVKANLFDNRVRTSLALYWAKYKNYQAAQGATSFGPLIDELTGNPELSAVIGTFVLAQGDVEAKGFEFEVTAAPTQGVTVGGSLSYNDTSFSNVPPLLLAAQGIADAKDYRPTYRPEWTGNIYAQYDSEPLFGDAYFTARLDANYQSKMTLDPNPNRNVPEFAVLDHVPAYWIVNGRMALRDINVGGSNAELSAWVKNLFNEDEIGFGLINANLLGSANYINARTFGLDLTVEF